MIVKIVNYNDPYGFEMFDGVSFVAQRLNTECDDFEVNLSFTDSKREGFGILLNKEKCIYIMNDSGKTIEKVLSYHTNLMSA